MKKQKDSSTVRLRSPQASLSETILQKLSTLEDLLKKKDDKPLTFKEACAYLGYAPSYLYKLTYRNIIPHYKPTGKMIFFSKCELDQWIYKSNVNTSATLTTKDPNQIEMGFDEKKKKRNEGKKKRFNEEKSKEDASIDSAHGHEIVVEFPRKKKR